MHGHVTSWRKFTLINKCVAGKLEAEGTCLTMSISTVNDFVCLSTVTVSCQESPGGKNTSDISVSDNAIRGHHCTV